MSQLGVLLVGHGTRSEAGIGCVEQLRRLVAERMPDRPVEHCFLELHERSIRTGLENLIAAGARQVAVVPLLLFAAGHAKSDIPRECLAAADSRVDLHQAEALGCHAALIELSQLRYLQTASLPEGNSPPKSCLLLVGRGSHDAQATESMHHFAALRRDRMAGLAVEVAFIAMARPSLSEMVESIARQGYERVIVQPHLLFPGDLFDQLEAVVAKQRLIARGCEWLLTPLLAGDLGRGGPADQLLVEAVVDRAKTALGHFGAG